jgi:hypothetical protein
MKDVFSWLTNRMTEPSSYAGFAAAAVGVAIVVDNGYVAIAGIAIAVLAFFLHERGII